VLPLDHFERGAEIVEDGHGTIVEQELGLKFASSGVSVFGVSLRGGLVGFGHGLAGGQLKDLDVVSK
jgi:hypothetical protein